MKKRIDWIDFGKGMTILLVVLGHVLLGIYEAKAFKNVQFLLPFIELLYIIHIPIFFALSGYFFKGTTRFQEYLRMILKKLLVLGVPYLLYNIMQYCLQKIGGGSVRVPTSLSMLLDIWQLPLGVSWYLYVLFMIFVVIGFIYIYIPNTSLLFYGSLLLFILGLVFPVKVYIIQKLLMWSSLFLFGRKLRELDIDKWTIKNRFVISIVTATILASFMYFWIQQGFDNYTSYDTPGIYGLIWFVSVLFGFSLYSLASHYLQHGLYSYFVNKGKLSLGIYIFHAPIVSVTRIVLLKFGIDNLPFHITLGLLAGWFGSLLAIKIVNSIPYCNFIFNPLKYIKIE